MSFTKLSMNLLNFITFPGLENGILKFHDFSRIYKTMETLQTDTHSHVWRSFTLFIYCKLWINFSSRSLYPYCCSVQRPSLRLLCRWIVRISMIKASRQTAFTKYTQHAPRRLRTHTVIWRQMVGSGLWVFLPVGPKCDWAVLPAE